MVPGWLQKALWAVYRPGQETSREITWGYLVVQTRCRLAIAEVEGKAAVAAQVRDELLGVMAKVTQVKHFVQIPLPDPIGALDAYIRSGAFRRSPTVGAPPIPAR